MDARDVLHRVECPVLVLHRSGDRVVPVQRAHQTCELLRSHGVSVELVEQPGEDHFLYAAVCIRSTPSTPSVSAVHAGIRRKSLTQATVPS
jgi:acetyl esterase/lipase